MKSPNPTQLASTPTNLFEHLTVFIDPSLPSHLAKQLKALLAYNKAKIAPSSTPNLHQLLRSIQPTHPNSDSDHAHPPPPPPPPFDRLHHRLSNLQPRFDLTSTTHIVTSSIHLPEYLALGRSDQQHGEIISFSFSIDPHQPSSEGSQKPSSSSDPLEPNIVRRTIHLITPLWVTQSYDLNKLLPTNAYSPDPYKFFSGIVVAIDSEAKLPMSDIELIQACLQAWGGQFRRALTKEVTHLICCDEHTRDYKIASKLKLPLSLKIVLPHWFHHSVFFRQIISEAPFEFPSPEILKPRSPSMSPDRQHGINGLPGTKLAFSSNKPITADSQLESWSHQTATRLAFANQNVPTRASSLGGSPAHRQFQNKSVYLSSSLGLSLSARRTLVRRIEELGAKVFDGHDSILGDSNGCRSDSPDMLITALTAEQELTDSDIVICEHRTGWEFWLAWDMNKQIGTLHWILGILNHADSPTSVIRPPTERLLDFPCPAEPIAGCEFDQKPITITNYTGVARSYLIRLIEKMHLNFSGSLDVDTIMVVAANKAGTKAAYATKLGTQIVNHHYVEDCFLNWSKQSIQPHHVSYPEGVMLCESIGLATRAIDSIYRWTKRLSVKEQKKRDLSLLPSKLASDPPREVSLPVAAPVTATNSSDPSRSPPPVLHTEILQSSIPLAPAGKRVKRKPRLISDSLEPSTNSTEDAASPAESTHELRPCEQDPRENPAESPRVTSEKESSQESALVVHEDDDVSSTSRTPRPVRTSSLKRTSGQLGSDPLVLKKKSTNILRSPAQPLDYSPPPRTVSGAGDEVENISINLEDKTIVSPSKSNGSSPTTKTPIRSARVANKPQDLDRLKSIKSPLREDSSTPASVTRSSSRRAAQIASKNVKSAAEDMNLHEKERKRKRPSAGVEDGGYFGLPPTNPPSSAPRRKIEHPIKGRSRQIKKGTAADASRLPHGTKGSKRSPRRADQEESGISTGNEDEGENSRDLGKMKLPPLSTSKRSRDDKHLSRKTSLSSNSSASRLSDTDDMQLDDKKPNQRKIKLSKTGRPTKGLTNQSSSKLNVSLSKSTTDQNSRKICISQSGERIDPKICNKLTKMGARFIDSTPTMEDGCTHLLTTKIARTEKFLSCILLGCLIVDHRWAVESARKNQFLDEEDYELKDSEGERSHGFELMKSLRISRSTKILESFEIFLTPHVTNLNSKLLRKLILLAGGKVLNKLPSIEELQRTTQEHVLMQQRQNRNQEPDDSNRTDRSSRKSIIISSKEDFKFLKNSLIKKFPDYFTRSNRDEVDNGDDGGDVPFDRDNGDSHRPMIKIFDSNLILEGLLIQHIKFDSKFELDYSELLQP